MLGKVSVETALRNETMAKGTFGPKRDLNSISPQSMTKNFSTRFGTLIYLKTFEKMKKFKKSATKMSPKSPKLKKV